MTKLHISIIEGNDAFRSALVDRLSHEEFALKAFWGVEDFLASANGHGHWPDIIISDVYLGGADGFSLLESLSMAGQRIPVILMSASGDWHMPLLAAQKGACAFIAKPFELETLMDAIQKACAILGHTKNSETQPPIGLRSFA